MPYGYGKRSAVLDRVLTRLQASKDTNASRLGQSDLASKTVIISDSYTTHWFQERLIQHAGWPGTEVRTGSLQMVLLQLMKDDIFQSVFDDGPFPQMLTTTDAMMAIYSRLDELSPKLATRWHQSPDKLTREIYWHCTRLQWQGISPNEYLQYASDIAKDEAANFQRQHSEMAEVYAKWNEIKAQNNWMEYMDMIAWTSDVITRSDDARRTVQEKASSWIFYDVQDLPLAAVNFIDSLSNVICNNREMEIAAVGNSGATMSHKNSENICFQELERIFRKTFKQNDVEVVDTTMALAWGANPTELEKVADAVAGNVKPECNLEWKAVRPANDNVLKYSKACLQGRTASDGSASQSLQYIEYDNAISELQSVPDVVSEFIASCNKDETLRMKIVVKSQGDAAFIAGKLRATSMIDGDVHIICDELHEIQSMPITRILVNFFDLMASSHMELRKESFTQCLLSFLEMTAYIVPVHMHQEQNDLVEGYIHSGLLNREFYQSLDAEQRTNVCHLLRALSNARNRRTFVDPATATNKLLQESGILPGLLSPHGDLQVRSSDVTALIMQKVYETNETFLSLEERYDNVLGNLKRLLMVKPRMPSSRDMVFPDTGNVSIDCTSLQNDGGSEFRDCDVLVICQLTDAVWPGKKPASKSPVPWKLLTRTVNDKKLVAGPHASNRENHIASERRRLARLIASAQKSVIFSKFNFYDSLRHNDNSKGLLGAMKLPVGPLRAHHRNQSVQKRSRLLDCLFDNTFVDGDDSPRFSASSKSEMNSNTLVVPSDFEYISFSQLSEYLACPYKFYLKRVARAASHSNEAMQKGSALHKTSAAASLWLRGLVMHFGNISAIPDFPNFQKKAIEVPKENLEDLVAKTWSDMTESLSEQNINLNETIVYETLGEKSKLESWIRENSVDKMNLGELQSSPMVPLFIEQPFETKLTLPSQESVPIVGIFDRIDAPIGVLLRWAADSTSPLEKYLRICELKSGESWKQQVSTPKTYYIACLWDHETIYENAG